MSIDSYDRLEVSVCNFVRYSCWNDNRPSLTIGYLKYGAIEIVQLVGAHLACDATGVAATGSDGCGLCDWWQWQIQE